ncbi:hypothetical protein DVH24_000014 [Malus domestica]|uniref:Uncharacterized protein n=1 Tax=Malus domestica TaxID=3750 RepID=A0A498J188_MALDO|nr:hypothetical protein DVH24_000014 [Malus domestica]
MKSKSRRKMVNSSGKVSGCLKLPNVDSPSMVVQNGQGSSSFTLGMKGYKAQWWRQSSLHQFARNEKGCQTPFGITGFLAHAPPHVLVKQVGS